MANMAPSATAEKHPVETIKSYADLYDWCFVGGEGKICLRLVRVRGRIFIDMREYMKTRELDGFTARGFRLNKEQAEKLLSRLPQLIDELKAQIMEPPKEEENEKRSNSDSPRTGNV